MAISLLVGWHIRQRQTGDESYSYRAGRVVDSLPSIHVIKVTLCTCGSSQPPACIEYHLSRSPKVDAVLQSAPHRLGHIAIDNAATASSASTAAVSAGGMSSSDAAASAAGSKTAGAISSATDHPNQPAPTPASLLQLYQELAAMYPPFTAQHVLYDQDGIVIVFKPAGIPSAPIKEQVSNGVIVRQALG